MIPPNSFGLLAQLTDVARIWYAVPLLIAISLVYGATRHEQTKEVLIHSGRFLYWTLIFFAIILGLVWFGGYWN
ncbi:MAG: hypothetical protein KF851_02160 [Pirellulaceae bacterium]|jgi:hypothetical protein|nr:hypothetical protein [Pirellulaceae bacterium]